MEATKSAKKYSHACYRLSAELIAGIRKAASEQRRSQTEIVRMAIENFLRKYEK